MRGVGQFMPAPGLGAAGQAAPRAAQDAVIRGHVG